MTRRFNSPYLAALAALAARLDARMEFKWPEFKKKEEIPEAFRDAYHEVEDKWIHQQEEPTDDRNPDKLKVALDKERTARENAEKEVKTANRKIKDLERDLEGKGTTKEVRDQIRKEVTDELKEEFAPTIKERDTLKGEVRGLKLDSQVKALAVKNGVRPEKVDRWWKLNQDSFDLSEDGSTAVVKNKTGADIGKYIANDLKKTDPEFYVGSQASGGGAGGSGGGGGGTGSKPSIDLILSNPGEAIRQARLAGHTE
jgi:hypothetical protein